MVEASEPLCRPETGSWTLVPGRQERGGSELGRPAGRRDVFVLLVLFQ